MQRVRGEIRAAKNPKAKNASVARIQIRVPWRFPLGMQIDEAATGTVTVVIKINSKPGAVNLIGIISREAVSALFTCLMEVLTDRKTLELITIIIA